MLQTLHGLSVFTQYSQLNLHYRPAEWVYFQEALRTLPWVVCLYSVLTTYPSITGQLCGFISGQCFEHSHGLSVLTHNLPLHYRQVEGFITRKRFKHSHGLLYTHNLPLHYRQAEWVYSRSASNTPMGCLSLNTPLASTAVAWSMNCEKNLTPLSDGRLTVKFTESRIKIHNQFNRKNDKFSNRDNSWIPWTQLYVSPSFFCESSLQSPGIEQATPCVAPLTIWIQWQLLICCWNFYTTLDYQSTRVTMQVWNWLWFVLFIQSSVSRNTCI